MALRNIRQIGDSVLNKKCKEIKEMTSRLEVLIEDMLDTMYEAQGVGLAAPQVGVLKRVVVIDECDFFSSSFWFIWLCYDCYYLNFSLYELF